MKGSCSYIPLYGQACTSTYLLHEIFFRNPEQKTIREFIDICKPHYEIIMKEMQERLVEITRAKDNLRYSMKLARIESRKQDIFYDSAKDQAKLDNMITLGKLITNNQCRNDLCMKQLNTMDSKSKIWTAHTFKPNGKRHLSFNFCSLNCMNRLRGKCGLFSIIQRGQLNLEVKI